MVVMNEKMIRRVVEQEAFEKEYQDYVEYVEQFEKMKKWWESYYHIMYQLMGYRKPIRVWYDSNTSVVEENEKETSSY